MIRFQSLFILSLVESSGRMCVGLAASLLYGFNPALPALISVDKPCFQSPYILSLVSRTDSIKIHLVDTDAVKPTVSPSLTEFSTVTWFCSQGTRSGGPYSLGIWVPRTENCPGPYMYSYGPGQFSVPGTHAKQIIGIGNPNNGENPWALGRRWGWPRDFPHYFA